MFKINNKQELLMVRAVLKYWNSMKMNNLEKRRVKEFMGKLAEAEIEDELNKLT